MQRSQDALASRYGDTLGSGGERYTPATPDEIAALDARLRKRGTLRPHNLLALFVKIPVISCWQGRMCGVSVASLRDADVSCQTIACPLCRAAWPEGMAVTPGVQDRTERLPA
jgi:hypothetical protein